MAPLGDGDDRKPAALRFWAVRKCDSLKSPAIFTDWEDCSFYVDQNDNNCKVEFSEFTSGFEALKYIAPVELVIAHPECSVDTHSNSIDTSPAKSLEKPTKKRRVEIITTATTDSTHDIRQTSTKEEISHEKSSLLSTNQSRNSRPRWVIFDTLTGPTTAEATAAATAVPPTDGPAVKVATNEVVKAGRKSTTVRMQRFDRMPTTTNEAEVPVTEPLIIQQPATTTDDNISPRKKKRAYRKRAYRPRGSKQIDPRHWEESFKLYLEFIQTFGPEHFTQDRLVADEKYKKLVSWRVNEMERIRDFIYDRKSMSEDETEKAERLLYAGFPYKASTDVVNDTFKRTARTPFHADNPGSEQVPHDLEWETNFQLFLEFTKNFGSAQFTPDRLRVEEKYKGLDSWRTQQITRIQNFIHNLELMSDEEAKMAAKLLNAGFPYSTVPLIDKSKQIPPKNKNESNTGQANDASKEHLVQQKNPNVSENSTKTGSNQSADDERWEKNFQLFLEFIREFGPEQFTHDRLRLDEKYKDLDLWRKAETVRIQNFVKNEKLVSEADAKKVKQLLKVGFPCEACAIPLHGANQCQDQSRKAQKWEEKFQLFLEFIKEFGPGQFTPTRLRAEEKYKKLISWRAKETARLRDFAKNRNSASGDDAEKAERLLNAGFPFKGSTNSMGFTRIPTNKLYQESDQEWEHKFHLFLEFIREFGPSEFTRDRLRVGGKYKQLTRWRTRELARVRDFLRAPDLIPELDAQKARRLLGAGFPTVVDSGPSKTWERNLHKLKEYKAKHGTIDISKRRPDYNHLLKLWLMRQRRELLKYESPKKNSRLTDERARKLRELGVETEVEELESKLPHDVKELYFGKMKELKGKIYTPDGFVSPADVFGHQYDYAEDESDDDYSTSTADSSEYGGPQGEDGNPDATLHVPTEPGEENSERNEDSDETQPNDLDAEKFWEKNFERLKQYKELYGTCDLIKNTTSGNMFRDLPAFMQNERRRIKRIIAQEKEDPGSVDARDKEKVDRLLNIGFVLEAGIEAKTQTIKLFKSPRLLSKKKTAMWETCFELLEKFKEKHGTCQVRKDLDGWSDFLEKWTKDQARHIKYFDENNERCTIDETRINRLRKLGLEKPLFMERETSGDWEEMFEQLKKFKEEHGHVNVPSLPKSALRNWILNQREHFQRLTDGRNTEMTQERMTRLMQLGLPLRVQSRKKFEERAREWLEYRTKHGKDPPSTNNTIGVWVTGIRKKYADRQEGKKTSLTQKQIDQLNDWGFVWDSGYKKPERVAPPKSWEERLQDLVAYREQHGHVNVPQAYPELGQWVHKQRREFSKLKRRMKSVMTPERIEKLRSVGFVFLTRKSPLEKVQRQKDIEIGLIVPNQDSEDESSPGNKKMATLG